MKNIFNIIFIICVSLFKSQQIYPLNTFPDDVPSGSYMKDLNNELNPFIGTWMADFNGKNITLIITKEEHKLFKQPKSTDVFYQDALIVNYIIKDLNGTILQNNSNIQHEYDRNAIISMFINGNVVNCYYTGTNCGVGWGEIEFKKLQSNQISWSYRPNNTVLTTKNCPGNQDTTIYLPETENLVFTKQ